MEPRYLHLGHYTRELKKRLPEEWFKPIPARMLWMVPHLLIAIAGIIAVAMVPLSGWAKLGLSVPIGLAFGSLALFGHEVLHGSVTRMPWLRNAIGFLCFLPFNLGPHLWRRWHNQEHHGHTQHEHLDPDVSPTLAEFEQDPGYRGLFFRFPPMIQSLLTFLAFSVWFSLYAVNMIARYFGKFQARERTVVLAQFGLSVSLWTGLLVLIGMTNFFYAVVVPVLIANFIVMSYISTNHVLSPLTHVNDPLANSLTVTAPRWIDALHLNFSHHTEHHIFPAMSPKYAPQVKKLIKDLWPERYHEMPHWKALRLIWRTPRLYADEISLTDPLRGGEYPVLGYGMDPDAASARKS